MYAGVDLGGTTIKLALGTGDGSLHAETVIPTESHRGSDDVLDRIGISLQQLSDRLDVKISGMGIGIPGLVDIEQGVTKFLPNLPTQWRDVPVSAILGQRFNCPVSLLNDVRTAALAELKFGHGRDIPKVTFAFFSIGTGIGGGLGH